MWRANLDEIEIQFEGNELFKYNRGFRDDNGRDFFQIQYLIRSFFQKLFILSAVVWEGGYHGIANRFCCRCYRCCVRLGCCSYGIEFLHSRRMYHIPISNFSIESRSSKLPRERSVFPGWSGRFSYRRSKWQLQTWDLSSSHCPPN